jgi:hypothetical protein
MPTAVDADFLGTKHFALPRSAAACARRGDVWRRSRSPRRSSRGRGYSSDRRHRRNRHHQKQGDHSGPYVWATCNGNAIMSIAERGAMIVSRRPALVAADHVLVIVRIDAEGARPTSSEAVRRSPPEMAAPIRGPSRRYSSGFDGLLIGDRVKVRRAERLVKLWKDARSGYKNRGLGNRNQEASNLRSGSWLRRRTKIGKNFKIGGPACWLRR